MSAVDQGYRYAINLPCDWIIVTSIRQTRLYYKGADQYTYERFETEALAGDEALLEAVRLPAGCRAGRPTGRRVPPVRPALRLREGRQGTDQGVLRPVRRHARVGVRASVPGEPRDPAAATCSPPPRSSSTASCSAAFCEDRGLLPDETIARAYQHSDPYNPRPIWDNFRGLFRAINSGNEALNIPAYNGGLFADDPTLDRLDVPDEVCRYFRDLADYEYRPPHEADAGDDGKLVDVDILGHIFEQSITDLERLQHELEGLAERQSHERARQPPQEGGGLLHARLHHPLHRRPGPRQRPRRPVRGPTDTGTRGKPSGPPRRVLADPRAYDLAALNDPQRAALVRFWEAWQDELAASVLLDPACGSGAFLIEAFEQFYQAYQRSNDRLEELRGHRTLFDLDRQILQNNLYGVDLNGEAVQIARLSLWIKTAQRGKVLTCARPQPPRRQQRRRRPGGPPAGLRLAGRVPRGLRARRLRRGGGQPALRPPGVDLARTSRTSKEPTRPTTGSPTCTSTSTSWACGCSGRAAGCPSSSRTSG